MKPNQHHSSFVSLYKKTMVILFLIACLPFLGHAQNVDSLKHLLKSSGDQEGCHLLFEIYQHYETIGEIDSMNVYAKDCLKSCSLVKKKGSPFPFVNKIIFQQYRQGFASNITPIADSLLSVLKNPDIKLQLLVSLSKVNFYDEEKEAFNNYWSQAKIALANTKEDYSRFVYYNFLGAMNSDQRNIIAALQSFEIAGDFADKNSQEYLKNSMNIAYIHLINADIKKAKDLFSDLLISAKENNQLIYQSYIYYALMDCYFLSEDYYETINIAHKSINHSIKNNLKVPEGYSYSKLGESYLTLSIMETNRDSLSKSTDANPRNNISITYLDSVKYYLEKGIEHSLENNHSEELASNYFIMADYHKAIGNRDKAKLYLSKAQNEDYDDKPKIDSKLADLWAEDKNYSKSYFHLKKYVDYLLQKEKNEKKDLALATRIIEDSYKYKEQSEVNLLIAKQKEERLRNIVALMIAGFVLFSIVFFYIQKNRKRLRLLNQQVAEQNKEFDILVNKQKETIKHLDNFASMAARDLKAPILTASTFANILSNTSGEGLDDKGKKYLDFIDLSVSQLSKMIDDLLSLSRLDANLPEEKEVDLKEVVSEIELLLSNLLKETNAKIVVESNLPKVMGHATLLSQLFQNLIKNAIVHNNTDNSSVIKINSAPKNDNSYIVKISDNSGGIPDYIVPTMFDLFSSSNKNTGNGIGLATCKKIVNHYGGEIWVDVDPGLGSTFNFNLFD